MPTTDAQDVGRLDMEPPGVFDLLIHHRRACLLYRPERVPLPVRMIERRNREREKPEKPVA